MRPKKRFSKRVPVHRVSKTPPILLTQMNRAKRVIKNKKMRNAIDDALKQGELTVALEMIQNAHKVEILYKELPEKISQIERKIKNMRASPAEKRDFEKKIEEVKNLFSKVQKEYDESGVVHRLALERAENILSWLEDIFV